MPDFAEVIRTREELRSVIREPTERVTRKTLSSLDDHCVAFIGRSPFVLIATCDAAGHFDISPKGDPPGFVRILDKQTLAIPERPGNNRVDSLENLLQNPGVGLIFLIPGKKETLRVSGDARMIRDAALRDSMAVQGRSPELAIVVRVREAFFHCSKCMIRSKLWSPDDWPDLAGLPRLARTMVDAGQLDLSEEEMHRIVEKDERERLY